MKYILAILTLCACGTLARAELPPALKLHADKFESDRAALTAAGEARLKPARERYLATLAAGQKSATAAAKTGDIAAIASEIEGVNTGALVEAFPPDLPRAFAQDRRTYIDAAASVAKTIPPRQRELATKYLQTLAAFDSTALKTKDAALTEAVAAEKTRVIALIEAAGGGQKFRNVVANGDFSQGTPGSFPPEWKAEAGDVQVTDATIVAEGTEKFLRFRRLQAERRANLLPEKEIIIPAKAKSVEFSVRLRVKGLVPGKDYNMHPGAHVTARDARGEEAGGEWAIVKQDTNWKRVTARFTLLPGAKTLRIAVGPFGAAGVLDVDDTEVKFQ
jgi:hypothetical protein